MLSAGGGRVKRERERRSDERVHEAGKRRWWRLRLGRARGRCALRSVVRKSCLEAYIQGRWTVNEAPDFGNWDFFT